MQRTAFGIGLLAAFALSAAESKAQLPGQGATGNATAQPGQQGSINFGAVDRSAVPLGANAAPVAAAPAINQGAVAAPLGPVAYPTYSFMFAHGAFQLQGPKIDALVRMSTPANFPNQGSIDVYRAELTYYGVYTDPATQVRGYLYYGDFGPPMNERRWFLFGDRDVARNQQDGMPLRNIIYYNSQGVRRYQTLATYITP